jgi:CheY-like chemotaxis protein
VTPLTIPSVGQDSRVATHPSDGTRQLGILIVDDEDPVRRILDLGLRAQGFTVWLAADTLTAVELYRGHHDAIDVVLLDVRMPDRDGPETLAALRELDPHVTCCFMSGDTGDYTQYRSSSRKPQSSDTLRLHNRGIRRTVACRGKEAAWQRRNVGSSFWIGW